MKSKRIALICILVLSVVFLIFEINYLRINKSYPNPTVKEAYLGETLEENGYTFGMKAIEFHDGSILDEIMPGELVMTDKNGKAYPGNKMGVVLATVTIEKQSADDSVIDFTRITYESGAWGNGISGELFRALNPNLKISETKMEQDQILEVVFPIFMVDTQFTKTQWKKVRDRDFSIVLDLYPQKLVLIGAERE